MTVEIWVYQALPETNWKLFLKVEISASIENWFLNMNKRNRVLKYDFWRMLSIEQLSEFELQNDEKATQRNFSKFENKWLYSWKQNLKI